MIIFLIITGIVICAWATLSMFAGERQRQINSLPPPPAVEPVAETVAETPSPRAKAA